MPCCRAGRLRWRHERKTRQSPLRQRSQPQPGRDGAGRAPGESHAKALESRWRASSRSARGLAVHSEDVIAAHWRVWPAHVRTGTSSSSRSPSWRRSSGIGSKRVGTCSSGNQDRGPNRKTQERNVFRGPLKALLGPWPSASVGYQGENASGSASLESVAMPCATTTDPAN